MDPAALKERVGRRAAEFVEPGMHVGLGTGSTVHWTIVALGERKLDLTCVATSTRTHALAQDVGLRVVLPDEAGQLDITIDGADEVDAWCNLTKGGGGALTREKIVASMARRFVVVVDGSKMVERLGAFALPVEVLPFAPGIVARRIEALGASRVTQRTDPSDNGNVILDAAFGRIDDPIGLATRLAAIPGVVEHGIFLADMVERVLVGDDTGVREVRPRR